MKKASIIILQLFCIVVFLSISANAQSNCTYTIAGNNNNTFYTAGSGSISVTTQPGCAWQATTNDSWINLTNGQNRIGSGSVNYSYGENSGAARTGTITIAGQSFQIFQPSSCMYNLNRGPFTVPAAGGNLTFPILPNNSVLCSYKYIRSNVPWIDFAGGVVVRANSEPARTGTFDIEVTSGSPFSSSAHFIAVITVNQESGCTYTLSPASLIVPQGGGTYTVNIITQEGCTWTAENHSPNTGLYYLSLTFTSPTTGTGSGKVDFTIPPSFASRVRSGRIYVNGATLEIGQDILCTPSSVSSTTINLPREGITNAVFYAALFTAGCNLTIRFNDSWITSAGSINGGHGYSVAPNNGEPRTGTISVITTSPLGTYQNVQTIAVNQAGQTNCTYSINPTSIQAGVSGGDTGFNLTTQAGCNWTAQSNVSWITVSNPTGSGAGRINYSVQTNTGEARTGTITVNGQTFTVNQDAYAVVQPTLINLRVKVVDANYKDIRNASVSFTNTATGETRVTQSNPFGWVLFSNVTNGQTYRIEIKHKRYTFITFDTVFDNNSVSNIFIAEP